MQRAVTRDTIEQLPVMEDNIQGNSESTIIPAFPVYEFYDRVKNGWSCEVNTLPDFNNCLIVGGVA